MLTNNYPFQKNSVLSAGFQMNKSKPSFSLTSNSENHDSHGNKNTILFSGSVNFPMSVISTKLYFVEIG